MYFTYEDFKLAVYTGMGFVGIIMIVVALVAGYAARFSPEPISLHLTSMILFVVGIGILFFCSEIVLLRDEPDTWR